VVDGVVDLSAASRRQHANEVAHWQQAVDALADLDAVAAPEAWASLETYLEQRVRERLTALVTSLQAEAAALRRRLSDADDAVVRHALLRLRSRYLEVETVLDFYGDAVNSRTNPELRRLLQGFDTLAGDSVAASLSPLGIDPIPCLVYVDKGLGAAILRAGIRLWDRGHPSPAAAIKLTRHNLAFPTALLHETGHQVGHLTGWNAELADAIARVVARRSREVGELWRSWASELAADVHAFVQAGWAPVAALANVVDGTTTHVYRIRLGDPHPFPLIRVAFNVACCRSWFGAGPWDDVGQAWAARHPLEKAPADVAAITRVSLDVLGAVVDACTRQPMSAFHGAPITAFQDPRRVSPASLAELERRSGDALLTSSYLQRRESLRIFALLSARPLTAGPAHSERREDLRAWVTSLGHRPGSPRQPVTARAS
jgi:hypothetical protein